IVVASLRRLTGIGQAAAAQGGSDSSSACVTCTTLLLRQGGALKHILSCLGPILQARPAGPRRASSRALRLGWFARSRVHGPTGAAWVYSRLPRAAASHPSASSRPGRERARFCRPTRF